MIEDWGLDERTHVLYNPCIYSHPHRDGECGSTEKASDCFEGRNACQTGGTDDRGDRSICSCPPAGAETADHFPVDNGRTQMTLTDIVGRADVRAVQEDEQAVPVLVVAFQEPSSIRVVRRAFEHPVVKLFDPLDPTLELWW